MLRRLQQHGVNPKTIVDIGANAGQFSVAAANFFPDAKIHAFEPLPECVSQLQHLAPRIPHLTVHPKALGDVRNVGSFHRNTYCQASSFLELSPAHVLAFPHAKVESHIDVEMVPLDDEFDELQPAEPTLMKIDVQGFERQVLQGAEQSLNRVKWIVMELSFEQMYQSETVFQDQIKLMDGYGFDLNRFVSMLADPRTGIYLQVDALFTRRE